MNPRRWLLLGFVFITGCNLLTRCDREQCATLAIGGVVLPQETAAAMFDLSSPAMNSAIAAARPGEPRTSSNTPVVASGTVGGTKTGD